MTTFVSHKLGGARPLTRRRLNGFGRVLGAVALFAGAVACSSAESGADGVAGVDTAEDLGEAASSVASGGVQNSPATLDQRFLPGIGYFDGTTCDIWPRKLDFSPGVGNLLDEVLSRYNKPAHVRTLRTLTTRMAEMGMDRATAVGSKYELVVTEADVPNADHTVVALDAVTRKGFMLNHDWLCSQELLSLDPLACQEYGVKVSGVKYAVLGRAQKAATQPSTILLHGAVVALVAPQIRFAPLTTNGEIVIDTHLFAIGQRIYGGTPYVPGEDLSKRKNKQNYAKVTIRRAIPAFPDAPTDHDIVVGLLDKPRPGVAALIGDEVGGIAELTAETNPYVQAVIVGFGAPEGVTNSLGALNFSPHAFFRETVTNDGVKPVPGENGNVRPQFTLTFNPFTSVRKAGNGSTAVLIAGSTPNTSVLTAEPGVAMGALRSADEIRQYVKDLLVPLLQPPGGGMIYKVQVGMGSGPVTDVDGRRWKEDKFYKTDMINLVANDLVNAFDVAYAPNDPQLENIVAIDAGTSTGFRQAALGGQLFSRGALANVMVGGAELDSLRTGAVSSLWADAWKLMADDSMAISRIRDYDPVNDLNLDPRKHDRAAELASYVQLDPYIRAKRNVLGLPYGQIANNWFTSSSGDGQSSILAMQQRWNALGSLVSAFQTAAERSDELKNKAERDALLQAVNGLHAGLTKSAASIATAATTVSSAARTNASTQATTLDQFDTAYKRVHDLAAQLQLRMNTQWGCSDGSASCMETAHATLDKLEDDCHPDNGGFGWAQPLVDLYGEYMPAVKIVNDTLVEFTGKNITQTMDEILRASSAGDGSIDAALLGLLADALDQLDGIEGDVAKIAQISQTMRKVIEQSTASCPAKGEAEIRLNAFRGDVILTDSLVQNYAIQMGLLRSQISSQAGHIGYLTSQGDAYERLSASQNALKTELDESTQPLLDKLNALKLGGSYQEIAAEQRAFMTAACGVALTAARTAQADLHVVSQALQTSTGVANTAPDLVLPASAAYRDAASKDEHFGYAMSLWDSAAFAARFTPEGDLAKKDYLSRASERFSQLVNQEVCANQGPKPASRFVVRKVFTGQALKTLTTSGQLDFKVTLDDLVASANDGSNPVKGVVAQNLQTAAFDLKLDGAFVLKTLYSACSGPAGKECTKRVSANNLTSVATGALNTLSVVSRGMGYIPEALVSKRVGRSTVLGCDGGEERIDSRLSLLLGGAATTVSSCLSPVLTPHRFDSAAYYDGAGLPDSQVLEGNKNICEFDARALVGQPLQGLPALGNWALANSLVRATSLSNSMAPAPIAEGTLAAPKGVTAVEVLFLVGTEPVKPSDTGGYTLTP